MSRREQEQALKPVIIVFIFILFIAIIISDRYYDRAQEQVDFLAEAEQAATVGAARDALERGMPWLEEHFVDSPEMRIWQSNLDYLIEQPQQALLPSQIKQSISQNSEAIYNDFYPGKLWDAVRLSSILMCFILATLFLMFSFPG